MDVRQVLPRDAIPSVDDPQFVPVEAHEGEGEAVVVDPAEVAGDEGAPARAYPLRYLHYHEIVNDVLGSGASGGRPEAEARGDRSTPGSDPDVAGADRPVAVTWCPLCGSAVVYGRTVDAGSEGRVLTFGVSGKLADDDLVMYDRETGSEWKQSTGVAVDGPLAGRRLQALPAAVLPVERFREAYPGGVVLRAPGGESEAASDTDEPAPVTYDADPYERYFSMEGFGLGAHRGGGGREWDHDLPPKAVVLGVVVGDDALAFPLERVERAGGLVRATVGGEARSGATRPRSSGDGAPRGGEDVLVVQAEGLHAYRDPGYDFEFVGGGRLAGDGTVWDGATGRSDDGRRLERLPARRLFAMAWADDHGRAAFWAPE